MTRAERVLRHRWCTWLGVIDTKLSKSAHKCLIRVCRRVMITRVFGGVCWCWWQMGDNNLGDISEHFFCLHIKTSGCIALWVMSVGPTSHECASNRQHGLIKPSIISRNLNLVQSASRVLLRTEVRVKRDGVPSCALLVIVEHDRELHVMPVPVKQSIMPLYAFLVPFTRPWAPENIFCSLRRTVCRCVRSFCSLSL